MMKRALLFLLSFVASVATMADHVSEERAARIARQFLNGHRPQADSPRMALAVKHLQPMASRPDEAAYYAFNIGEDEGFVLVSGSDLGPQVLGYADKGNLNQATMPTNMKAWQPF